MINDELFSTEEFAGTGLLWVSKIFVLAHLVAEISVRGEYIPLTRISNTNGANAWGKKSGILGT